MSRSTPRQKAMADEAAPVAAELVGWTVERNLNLIFRSPTGRVLVWLSSTDGQLEWHVTVGLRAARGVLRGVGREAAARGGLRAERLLARRTA